jgi:nucleoside-diphosphate-sugar epimerase
MINTMKILVTGGTGRIGRHLVAALLEEGEKVRVLAREPQKAKELWGDAVEAVQGDVTDRAAVAKAAEGVDAVYHLAALVSYDAPRETLFSINVEGTRNVLEAAKGKRIIYLSSTSVYGKKAASPITEQTPFSPTDIYGESKAAADNLARAAGAIVLRPTVVYGFGFSEGFFKLFDMVVKKKMVIAGNGRNMLQWSHISDVVAALLLARKKGTPGGAYDIVGDDVKTQEQFLGMVARLLNVPAPKTKIPMVLLRTVGTLLVKPAYIETFASDRFFDCSKAKRDLGWQPKITFEEGLKDVVAEYTVGRKSAPEK